MTRADRFHHDRDIARCDGELAEIAALPADFPNGVLAAMGDADWRIERTLIAEELTRQALAAGIAHEEANDAVRAFHAGGAAGGGR